MIQRHLQIEIKAAREMIDVAHRGGKRKEGTGRAVFVAFKTRKEAQKVLAGFAKLNKNNKDMKIKADQMFSKNLTSRRHAALKTSKELLEDKAFVKAHITYPADLMVKKAEGNGYELYRSF